MSALSRPKPKPGEFGSRYPAIHEFGKPIGLVPFCGEIVFSPLSGRDTTCGFPRSAPCHRKPGAAYERYLKKRFPDAESRKRFDREVTDIKGGISPCRHCPPGTPAVPDKDVCTEHGVNINNAHHRAKHHL